MIFVLPPPRLQLDTSFNIFNAILLKMGDEVEIDCPKCEGEGTLKKGLLSKGECEKCEGTGKITGTPPTVWESMLHREKNIMERAEALRAKGIEVKTVEEVCGPVEKVDAPLWDVIDKAKERLDRYEEYLEGVEDGE